MNRQDFEEDFSPVAEKLRELDRQIPVPFAATAQGLQARLSAAAPKKSRLPRKWIWSAASLLLVVVIGCALWPSVQQWVFTVGNDTSAGLGVAPQMNNADPSAVAYAENTDSVEDATPAASPPSQKEAGIAGDGAETSEKSRLYYPAEDYQQIRLALRTIPLPVQEFSSSAFNNSNRSLDSLSVTAAERAYRYSLTCATEETSRLDIYDQDGTLLSQTDVDYCGDALFAQDQTLVLAGENADGTLLQFFDISDPASPVLQRTFVQQGAYLGCWESNGVLLIGSFYQLDSKESFIPVVYDSNESQAKKLEAGQILLSDHCTFASYAVVTAISLEADSASCSFAVLGGDSVNFSSGWLSVSTAGNETDFSVQQEELLDIAAE